MRYTRDDLVQDLELIWRKNKPLRVVYYKKNGKKKELHIWAHTIGRKRKYIELCLDDFK